MGSTDVRVFILVKATEEGKWGPISSAPNLTCIAARAEQRHTTGRHDNVRCLLIGVESRSVVSKNDMLGVTLTLRPKYFIISG